MRFKDRREAGRKLADALIKYKDEGPVVYALPRGGVILGYEIKKELKAKFDLVITRKIGHPESKEYAICAVAEDGHMVCNESERKAVDQEWFYEEVNREQAEAKRRRETYLSGRVRISARGKTAILVDDGIATGLTIKLAIQELKHDSPKKIVIAAPSAPRDVVESIKDSVDDIIVLDKSEFYLGAVGAYYDSFPQVEDNEVIKLLNKKR